MSKNDLNEYINLVVEQVLTEYQGGMGGHGRLRDIFLQPAKDVISTAGYAAERISGVVQTLVKGLSYIVPTILIPGLEFDYELFKKDEDARMAEIKKKYGDVLARNWEAIKDPDVFGFLFLAYPQAMLGYAALKRSPLAFLQLLEIATGGLDSVRNLRSSLERSSAYTPRQRHHNDPMGGWAGGGAGNYVADYYGDYAGTGLTGESVNRNLKEAPVQPPQQTQAQQPQQQQADPQMVQQIWALMQQPDIKQALAQSPMFKEMQNAAVDVMVSPVARFMKVQNLEQMKGFIDPAAIEKAKAEVERNADYQKADEASRKTANDELLAQVKKAYKEAFIKKLVDTAKNNPQTKPEVDAAIAKIRQLQ